MIIRIVTDVLLFFVFFSLLLGFHFFFLSPLSPFPPLLPPCLASVFCCLSWRFCTTDSVSPAPFTALPNPASRPSTPTKYWLLLICSVSPLPCGVSHRAHISAVVKRGHGWELAGAAAETCFTQGPGARGSLAWPPGLQSGQNLGCAAVWQGVRHRIPAGFGVIRSAWPSLKAAEVSTSSHVLWGLCAWP